MREECHIESFSSRTCEHGTKGCAVKHSTCQEYVFGQNLINIHPSIYPKLIRLWNLGPRHYRDFLRSWHFSHGECEKILDKLQEWVKVQKDQNMYLNEY